MGIESGSIWSINSGLLKAESGVGKAEAELRQAQPQRSVEARASSVREILMGVKPIMDEIAGKERHSAVERIRKASEQVDAAQRLLPHLLADAEGATDQISGKERHSAVERIRKASEQVDAAQRLFPHLLADAEGTTDQVAGKERPSALAQARKQFNIAGHELKLTPVREVEDPRLQVAGSAHSGVRVSGLGSYFPKGYIHAQRSTGVVTANECTLTSVDHYHVYKADLSMRPLFESQTAKDALKELAAHPDAMFAVSKFRDAIRPLRTPSQPSHETRVNMPVKGNHVTAIDSCAAVQQADHSSMRVNTHHVVEETKLPLVDLLLDDTKLVRLLPSALAEPEPGHHTAAFLRHSLRVGGRTKDLDLLNHASGLETPNTSVFAFFGIATVDEAPAIMIGGDNKLKTGVEFDRPTIGEGDLLSNLKKLRASAVPDPHTKNQRIRGKTKSK